ICEVKHLKELKILGCEKVTDLSCKYISNLNLKTLSISNCAKMTDDVSFYLRNMSLEYLDLSWCKQMTDKVIQGLMEGKLKNSLKFLKMNGNKITNVGIESIANHCTILEKLHLQ